MRMTGGRIGENLYSEKSGGEVERVSLGEKLSSCANNGVGLLQLYNGGLGEANLTRRIGLL